MEENLSNKESTNNILNNEIFQQNDVSYDMIYENNNNILIKKPKTKEEKQQKYNFINNPELLELLKNANEILHITKSPLNKIIFVYSHPKVGSTSLVTSIRMFASHIYNVIHIHLSTF